MVALWFLESATLLALLFTVAGGNNLPRRCQAVPGTCEWPTATQWKSFNDSLGGKLLQPLPPGAPCHSNEPSYNPQECAVIEKAWFGADFHV